MSARDPSLAQRGPSTPIKLVISALILFHASAILVNVIAAAGPFVTKSLCAKYRPYLQFMWLTNAYRFYAPDPGPTDVVWYRIKYEDGTSQWRQVPDREAYALRMPFQRHMSVSMLAMMMAGFEEIPASEDAASGASMMIRNQGNRQEVLSPMGEVYFRAYARFIARKFVKSSWGSPFKELAIYRIHYNIRSPYQVRLRYDMYDPRLLDISMVGTYSADGTRLTAKRGFVPRVADDFFIELVQTDIIALVEENDKLPADRQKSIGQLLRDYGVPYPLILPLVRKEITPQEQRKFFDKPLDRDTLRQRYADIVRRFDKTDMPVNSENLNVTPKTSKGDGPPGEPTPRRSIQ